MRSSGSNAPRRGAVEISIGELELVGFPAARRYAIAQAVERALGELAALRELPAAPRRASEARVRSDLDPHAAPEQVGRAIAEAVWRAARSDLGGRRP